MHPSSASSGALHQLRQELLVLKEQLIDEKEISNELREELISAQSAIDALRLSSSGTLGPQRRVGNTLSERDDLLSRFVEDEDDDEVEGGAHRVLSSSSVGIPQQLGDVFRASSAMTIRYVPPVDFLPAVFVEQYADVLMIVDRYAQLYHRYHVGGGQRDAQLAVRDEDTQRSERELLEARVRQLEADVEVRDSTIAALKEQLVAWRTTGHDRPKFQSHPAHLGDTMTSSGPPQRYRNNDGDISSSDMSLAPAVHAGDNVEDRRQSPRRSRRRFPPSSPRPSAVQTFPAALPQRSPTREQTPLIPLDASSPGRPVVAAPQGYLPASPREPPQAADVNPPQPAVTPSYASAPPRNFFASTAPTPQPQAAPNLLDLYAPPRPLFGGDAWNYKQPNTTVVGPGGVVLPIVPNDLSNSGGARHPWGAIMQNTA